MKKPKLKIVAHVLNLSPQNELPLRCCKGNIIALYLDSQGQEIGCVVRYTSNKNKAPFAYSVFTGDQFDYLISIEEKTYFESIKK